MKIIALIALIGSVFLLIQKGQDQREHTTSITGNGMGTTWSLRCHEPEQYRLLIQQTIQERQNLLSHWMAGSELSKYNAGILTQPSSALKSVLTLAEKFKQETKGAYDHSLLRQTQSAGFAPVLPTDAHHYDLSGIAKGHTVDLITQKLHAAGLKDFVIELGGECYASGLQADQTPWPVLIYPPTGGEGEEPKIVYLSNQAIATSGNYHQISAIKDNQISSHLIHPETGIPHRQPAMSVSVIAPDCTTADAYATALFINPRLPLPSGARSVILTGTKR